MAELPRPARRLLIIVALLAVALAAAVLLLPGGRIDLVPMLALAAGIAVGELLRVDLPQRGGGTASFGLGDAALTAGLLLLGPAEVVLGAVIGVTMLQGVERVPPIKFALNVAQYTAGAAAAALAVHALAPATSDVGPATVAVVAVGVALFLAFNVATVSGMIALTGARSYRTTLAAVLPTAALLALGDLALGTVAVLLGSSHAWALVALAVPVLLLWYASRLEVHAHLDRVRGAAFVEVEHALGAAATPDAVLTVLAEAATKVLGCQAAVWQRARWVTPVPEGSTSCPVDASLSTALYAPGATLGLAVEQDCVAIGLGGGVLVGWPGELGLDADSGEWMGRLGQSGRVHFSRAAGAVALEKERQTLGAVVDGTGDGVMLLDSDGSVAVWNPAMARLSGIAVDVAVGRGVADLLGEGPWQVAGVHDVTPPSTGSVWRIAVAAVEDTAVATAGRLHVVAVHDVTAERRASRARDDMLAVVSHELRTPLTPIIASAQMLRRRSDRLSEAQRAELLAQIEDRAGHLSRLVDDLVLAGQLSATTSRVPRLTIRAIRVDDLVGDAVAAMRLANPGHDLKLHVVDNCNVATDPVRLRQILDNLLDNACKFSAVGSEVTVAVTLRPGPHGHVVLTVADQGCGIPPSDMDRVFEQFVRVEDPLTMTTSGAGLGLFIVRQLIEALGGTLRLESQVGIGTTVTLHLPLASAQAESSDPDHQPIAG
ncbi:MAG TPA: PAS domain-containing sensor histidine kinase [Euzebya sp.]|nr:PAS domain-containing sensor histidine kinase [Euzebya sp.]